MRHPLLVTGLPAVFLLACSSTGSLGPGSGTSSGDGTSSSTGSGSTGSSGSSGGMDAGVIGGDRPVEMRVPASYVPGTAVPLVMMLHGYSADADIEELYLDITAQSNKLGFIYALPNGTVDSSGLRFWNATNACCNLYGSTVDDSAYLSSVITQIQAAYTIDPKRIWLVGHSNGGFMSYRMACDHADQIAAIASLAGAMWEDTTMCTPSEPVAVVEMHGTADTVIAYDGGLIGVNAFPSAPTTVSDWVTFDGCSSTPDTTAPPLDLDLAIPGNATTVTRYATGCKPGGHAELWTMVGSEHIPDISTAFTPDVIQYLYQHPKP
jgi:polyhydroxybutyrate depolymerase